MTKYLTNNNDAFIPTLAEWSVFFTAWRERLEKSLRRFGGASACEEAVQEAFVKVLGLSDHLRLAKTLTPRTEGQWYAFIYYQAKARLFCFFERDSRYLPLKEWGLAEATMNEDDWGDPDDDSEPASGSVCLASDGSWFRDEFRKLLSELCRSAGVKDCHRRAFVRFVLDEMSGEDVVDEIPEIHNANNLYQIKKRIMELLMASAGRFEELYDELMAA